MYGRRLLSCVVEASDSQLYLIHHVHGRYEYPQCNHSGIHTELYGNRSSRGCDFLGKHALFGGTGTINQCMVDDRDTGSVSVSYIAVHYQYRKLYAEEGEQEAEQPIVIIFKYYVLTEQWL